MIYDVSPERNNRKGFLPPTYVKETDPYFIISPNNCRNENLLAKDNSNYLISVCNYQKNYYYEQKPSVKRFRSAAMLRTRPRETTLLHLLTIWDAKKDTLFPKYRTRRRNKLKLESSESIKSLMETGQQQRKLISTLNIPEVKRIKVVEVLLHGRYFENDSSCKLAY